MTYRPDDSPLSSFEEVLKPNYIQALMLSEPIVILGDLNCDWLRKACSEFKALEKFYSEMNLRRLITKPTRMTANTESLLDVILVSPNSLVQDSGIIHRPIRDYSVVFVKLKVKRTYRNYRTELFTRDLANEADSLLSIFEESDVDSKLNILDDVLLSVLSSHAPIKSIVDRFGRSPIAPFLRKTKKPDSCSQRIQAVFLQGWQKCR